MKFRLLFQFPSNGKARVNSFCRFNSQNLSYPYRVSIPFKRESTCERSMNKTIQRARVAFGVSIPFKRESTCER